MLAEFEQRLVEVVGTHLPAPFTGRAERAPGAQSGTKTLIILGVKKTERVEPDLGSYRAEITPGSTDQRRVVRLTCEVDCHVRAAASEGRTEQMQLLDAAIYALDASDFRDGSALVDAANPDPGFLIAEMRVLRSVSPLDPDAPDAPRMGLSLKAEGWFWPVGTTGETGRQIGEIRVRGVTMPLEILPADPHLAAGGDPISLTVRIRTAGTLLVREQELPPIPFGSVALSLVGPDGGPGAGTLTGGAPGNDGVRVLPVTDGGAIIQYTPPAEAAHDELVVAMENGEGGQGIELGTFVLNVREA